MNTNALAIQFNASSAAHAVQRWLGVILCAFLVACGGGEASGAAPEVAAAAAASTPDVSRGALAAQVVTSTPNASATRVAAPAASVLTASQLVVLVAEGDALSESVARAYQQARGIPQEHVVRVRMPSGVGDAISQADFELLKRDLDKQLGSQAQALLVTWAQPSRVQGPCAMSITSALTFGFDARYCGQCSRTQASPYYNHRSAQPFTDLGLRPAMMLGASSIEQAQRLIERGLQAEGLMAQGTLGQGYLMRTADSARSVRWPDFQGLAALALPGVQWQYQDASGGAHAAWVAGKAKLMFYFTGLAQVPEAQSNEWLPGAYADHLTSYGGLLPHAAGQMPATAWLDAGATGSYGTVEEPCNYQEKFPRASVLADRYSRGETLLEAVWKSVQWPGQGLMLGDPLSRPWVRS